MSTVLEAVNVRVEYGALVAVSGLSLQLSGGQLLGLIGPNGAGKTTTLKALAGLLPLAAGRVNVLGREVRPDNPPARACIGFAPDTPPVYDDLTIADFLRFIGRAYRLQHEMIEERIDFWLERLWLADRRKAKIKTLSRGMRQRLTIARTLLPDPVLALLDEPAAGLDPAGRVEFRKLLISLRDQGKALIVSSHILADLHEYCTHIAIMEAGRLVQCGTVAQVVGGKADNRCRYNLTLVRPVPEAARILESVPRVSHVEAHGRELDFEFEHEDQAAADLLRLLLQQDLPVASFAPAVHDLEQAYLRTGIKQVD
jgi:ABC-2 type transport system ATP-binding protein